MFKIEKRILISLIVAALSSGKALSQAPVTYNYDLAGNVLQRVPSISVTKEETSTLKDTIQPIKRKEGVLTDSTSNEGVQAYPNPTQGKVTVTFTGYQQLGSSSIYLYSVSGSLLVKEAVTGTTTDVDLSRYPAGAYVLKVYIEGETCTWKIIKE
jgi:hypothetical protein